MENTKIKIPTKGVDGSPPQGFEDECLQLRERRPFRERRRCADLIIYQPKTAIVETHGYHDQQCYPIVHGRPPALLESAQLPS